MRCAGVRSFFSPFSPPSRKLFLGKAFLFILWLVAVGIGLHTHAFWRDEVRALSLALQGDTVWDMILNARGDHPFVWLFLLRGAYALFPTTTVLPVVAFLVALLSVLLFLVRSPFGILFTALFLFGKASLYEYSVMARNYGISMLLLFLCAALYRKKREKGFVLGLLLALLANCNIHSVILAVGFLFFWGTDLLSDRAFRVKKVLLNYALNVAIVLFGIALCFLSVYPPANDAGLPLFRTYSFDHVIFLIVRTLFNPGSYLPEYVHFEELTHNIGIPFGYAGPLLLVLIAAIPLGLISRPGAMVAGWGSFLGLWLLYGLIYPGSYRHQQLWLFFLLSLYWAAAPTFPAIKRKFPRFIQKTGFFCLGLYMAVNVVFGIQSLALSYRGIPESQSRALVKLIQSTPAYRDAILIADPDCLLEPLPYYVTNLTYLIREQRWGLFSFFKRDIPQNLTLKDILETARRIHEETGKTVLIVMEHEIYDFMPPEKVTENYTMTLHITPMDADAFLRATRLVQLRRKTRRGESYDVYEWVGS